MDQALPAKKPYKRRMTEKRKQQNRAAQQNYRQKQNARIAELERIAGLRFGVSPTGAGTFTSQTAFTNLDVEIETQGTPVFEAQTLGTQQQTTQSSEEATNLFPEIDIVSGNQFEGCFDALPAWPPLGGNLAYNPVPDNSHLGEIPQDFSRTSLDPASTPHINDTITPMNFLAAWKTDTARLFPFFAPFTPPAPEPSPNLEALSDLASLGGRKLAWQSLRYLSQLSIPEDTQRLLRVAIEQKLDLATIFLSGIQASIEAQDGRTTFFNLGDLFVAGLQIVNTDKQRTLPSRSISRLMTPDLESNCFKMLQVPLIDAFLCCAEALGLTADRFYDDYCSSPFYNPEANASDIDEIRKLLSKGIPRSLRPTNEQITHIHHPFLDLIPFPSVRSKALILMSYSPPRFDYWGFKKDIGNHGMICWQTDRAGSADPTDGRSWEGEPWFLKKWWSLFGGEDGELWESTTWWRRFRGEPLSVEDLERNDILTPPSWRHRGFDRNGARD